MSIPKFSARFTLYSATQVPLSITRWQCVGKVEDAEGTWSASHVSANDAVFLDTQGDVPQGGSVCRYKVVSINSADTPNYGDIDFVIEYVDSGTPVDPNIAGYQYSFICGASTNTALAWIAANDVQLLPQRLVTFARNSDMFNIIDPFQKKLVKNTTGAPIAAYRIVAWNNDGTVSLADATLHDLSDVAGITTQSIANNEWGYITKRGYIPDALTGMAAAPGDTVFLDPAAPGHMTLTDPTIGYNFTVSIIRIGRAEPPSGVASANAIDLDMEMIIEQEI